MVPVNEDQSIALVGQSEARASCRVAGRALGTASLMSPSPGWRRSADRTRLQANSLISGKFTGKFGLSEANFVARNRRAAATFRAIPYSK